MVHFNSIQAGLLATAVLSVSGTADADTVVFIDDGTFSTGSLTEGNVTVTGSANVQSVSNSGLGIVGGISSLSLDPGETMIFNFANPVTDVVISDFTPADTDGNGLTLNATFFGVEPNGSITIVATAIDPFLPIDVFGILGVPSMSSFDITMNMDGIRVRAISFQELEGAPVYSCTGFDAPMNLSAVTVKKNRVLPHKAQLHDENGTPLNDLDITSPPVIQVMFDSYEEDATDVTGDAYPAGAGSDGNQFEFLGSGWQFNLKTKNYTAAGTYTITMESGDADEYLVDPTCTASFVIN